MEEFAFTGLGTKWFVRVDGSCITEETKKDILHFVDHFEKRFSRFLRESEVNAFRTSRRGFYPVSSDLFVLLKQADILRTLTKGKYNPVVASFLEEIGYGSKHNLPHLNRTADDIPQWILKHQMLFIDGPIAFDFGGIGKGYCIDKITHLLRQSGYKHFLVDGGGDMFATTKADGSAFLVAIEYPGKPDMAVSIVQLANQGLAMSDGFRRRFGKWNHLIDMESYTAVEKIIGCAGLADTAFMADSMTSGIFFAPEEQYSLLEESLKARYMVFKNDATMTMSTSWPGEIL